MNETLILKNVFRIPRSTTPAKANPGQILNILATVALMVSLPGLPASGIIFLQVLSGKSIERQDVTGLVVEIALLALASALAWLRLNFAVREACSRAAQLEAVLQNVADGVLMLDTQGSFVSANPALRRMIPEERLREINALSLEEMVRWKRTVFSVHATPVPGAGSVVIFHDETRRHETEQARAALQAPASHKLRTPFSSVMNYLELLLMQTEMGEIDIDKFWEHLQRAIENNRRLRRLVNDMLDHAQLQAGMLKLKQQAFHLSSLFEKVHLSLDALLKEKRLFYELQIASDVPAEIRGEPGQLQKVLVNVIGNAVKFTTHGGIRVWVSIAPGGALSIEVMDSGPGIAPEQLPNIFEAFRCKRQGAGLGLAITKQIVMSMGGRISVFSVLGAGSTFKITLPLDEGN